MTPTAGPGLGGRFALEPAVSGAHVWRDRLVAPGAGARPAEAGRLDADEFVAAFLRGVLSWAGRAVIDRPPPGSDAPFWQFPCRTEAAAFENHRALAPGRSANGTVHVYLGLPWATWIDRHRADALQAHARQECYMQRVRIGGFRRALAELGKELRVHTVCQHIGWREWLPRWRAMGITDAWLSHAPPEETLPEAPGLRLHPWRLFAVNVEDLARRERLVIGRDPADKPLLASFVGAHADHYLGDARLRLLALADAPGFVVRVTGQWHFEDVVYGHQVARQPLAASYRIGEEVSDYNRLLSDSVFSLCPAGAGPNTLRLWESLATGAVPVLLGPPPQLPRGGSLAPIDWESIVVRVPVERIAELPSILRAMPVAEVRRRQRNGIAAFAAVQQQCCF